MTLPVFVPGQVLAASDVNRFFMPMIARKPSDESLTSSTVLQDDNDLLLTLEANGQWNFEFMLTTNGPTAAGIKVQLTGPSGSTATGALFGYSNTGVIWSTGAGIASPVSMGTPSFITGLLWKGTIVTGVTAGIFKLQWAQGTSNATAVSVLAGSTLTLQRSG